MSARRAFALAVLACLTALEPASARAAPQAGNAPRRILLAGEGEASPLERELSVRLAGELSAAGFAAAPIQLRPGTHVVGWLSKEVQRLDAAGGFGLERLPARTELGETSEGLRLWMVLEESREIDAVEVVRDAEAADASVLAVRAVERLSARLDALAARPVAVVLPPAPPEPLPPPVEGASLSLEAGVVALLEPSAPAGTANPSLGVALEAPLWRSLRWGAGASVAGLGRSVAVQSALASADIRQSLALATGRLGWGGRAGCLYALTALGAYSVGVRGRAASNDAGLEGRDRSLTSALGGAGLGARLTAGRVQLRLEGQALWAVHPAQIELARTPVSTFGSPLLTLVLRAGVLPF